MHKQHAQNIPKHFRSENVSGTPLSCIDDDVPYVSPYCWNGQHLAFIPTEDMDLYDPNLPTYCMNQVTPNIPNYCKNANTTNTPKFCKYEHIPNMHREHFQDNMATRFERRVPYGRIRYPHVNNFPRLQDGFSKPHLMMGSKPTTLRYEVSKPQQQYKLLVTMDNGPGQPIYA